MNYEENDLCSIRFIGTNMDLSGVPIYDLSEVLLSIQRIINKAYLASWEHPIKKIVLSPQERIKLSLTIGRREKGSDV